MFVRRSPVASHHPAVSRNCVRTSPAAVLLAASAAVTGTSAAAVIPANGIYAVQTPAVHAAPHFIIEHGQLRHTSGALPTPLCQLPAGADAQFVLDHHLQFQYADSGTAVHAESGFTAAAAAALVLQAAPPHLPAQGLDTTHCRVRAQYRAKKMGS